MKLLESRTLSQNTLVNIMDMDDNISEGEIMIGLIGQYCIFRNCFDAIGLSIYLPIFCKQPSISL